MSEAWEVVVRFDRQIHAEGLLYELSLYGYSPQIRKVNPDAVPV